jgi:hypothetical protein
MSNKPPPANQQTILKQVFLGMQVYDANQERIGVVASICYGVNSEESSDCDVPITAAVPSPALTSPALGALPMSPPSETETVSQEVINAFQQLRQTGFIKVEEGGLTGGTYYISPTQISAVAAPDRVILQSDKTHLLRV